MISRFALDHWYTMMLSFIDRKLTDGVKIIVKDRIYQANGQELYGETIPDHELEDCYSVMVSKNSNQVATLIHEFLHKMFPDQDEEFIGQLEKEIVVSLTTDQLKKFEKYLR